MAKQVTYTKTQLENAKLLIMQDMANGMTFIQSTKKLMYEGYGDVKYGHKNTAQDFVAKVRRELKETFRNEVKDLYESQYYRLSNLYAKCLNDNDRQTAFQCLKEINRLAGFTLNQSSAHVQVLLNGESGKTTNDITISFNTDNETVQIEEKKEPKDIEIDAEIIED